MIKMLVTLSLITLLCATSFAAEQTLRELESQLETIDAQQKHAEEAFERGRMEIQAGALRQGLAATWKRELESKRLSIEAEIKRFKGAEKK